MMANGGYVDSPTLAMIGEAGPELVVPLNRPSRAEALLQGAGLNGGGSPAVMIQSANFYDGTDADLVAQKTMLALSARRLTA
jgi:SLT domain-containing protein